MTRRTLLLSDDERRALVAMRQRDPTPYKRERAAALLQIADGRAPYAVARDGCLGPREPDTLYCWLDRYVAEGIDGLTQRPRTRAFSP
jgi:hypothetical protein